MGDKYEYTTRVSIPPYEEEPPALVEMTSRPDAWLLRIDRQRDYTYLEMSIDEAEVLLLSALGNLFQQHDKASSVLMGLSDERYAAIRDALSGLPLDGNQLVRLSHISGKEE